MSSFHFYMRLARPHQASAPRAPGPPPQSSTLDRSGVYSTAAAWAAAGGGGSARQRSSTPPRRDNKTGSLRRPRVLVVDDDPDTREMYVWCLRAGGWLVEEASTGEEALFVAGAFSPDVIVMDLHLPGIDGVEATRRLHKDERSKDIPIVACSGVSRLRTAAEKAGCKAVICKPYPPEKLRELLEGLVAAEPSGSAG